MKDRRTLALVFSVSLCLALLEILLVLAGRSAHAQATTRYVTPSGDCNEASPCYSSIQAAVDDAADGDTIKVSQGVYTTTGLTVVYISQAITVTGGYTTGDWIHALPVTQPTVIDAEDAVRRRGIVIQGTSAATITLKALTIQHGHAQDTSAGGGGIYVASGNLVLEDSRVLSNTTSGDWLGAHGGGVFLPNGQHIMRNVLVQGNHAGYGGGISMRGERLLVRNSTVQGNSASTGGGLYADNYMNLTLTECIFSQNSSGDGGGLYARPIADSKTYLYGNTFQQNQGGGAYIMYGFTFYIREDVSVIKNVFQDNSGSTCGGLYVAVETLSVRDNVFIANTSDTGGGLYALANSAILHSNRFEGNQAYTDGGGMAMLLHGDGVLTSNTFTNNLAGHRGGGAFLFGGGNLLLRDNLFQENTAASAGGGLAIENVALTGTNDIVVDNTSPFEGVAILSVYGDSALSAAHWTLADNGSYALTTDGGTATLTNTIVATHSIGGFAGLDIRADHTLFFNSGTPCSSGALCTNNLSGDPDFVDPGAGDYHIGPASSAIDAGTDAGILHDIDHEPRFGVPDLGADEYWAPGTLKTAYLPLVLRYEP